MAGRLGQMNRMRKFEKKVADDYNFRFDKYGAQPKASLWFSEQRQLLRFELIIKCIKNSPAPSFFDLNDIGCGYGGFLKQLQGNFDKNQFCYRGFDLASEPVEYCKRHFAQKGMSFFCGSIPSIHADFNIMSGTFNYAPGLTLGAWKDYLFSSLNSTWSITRHRMIFNLMISEQAKITPQSISYIEKEAVINFCQKNLGETSTYFSSKLSKEITFCVQKK